MILQPSSRQTISAYGAGPAAVELQARQGEALGRLARNRALVDVLKVSKRQDDWDGFGSLRPSDAVKSAAVEAAINMIEEVVASGLEWQHPHISSNEDGEISFEWWHGEKKLTVYIGGEESRYVSSWGANIDTHMDAGPLIAGELIKKWRWFRT